MLDRSQEYEKMAGVELEHWWYETLHRQVLSRLEATFKYKKISILDAGCGTGGLLLHLQQNGYHDIYGFDLSNDAVKYCIERDLTVETHNLNELSDAFAGIFFDVIISNDTMYYLNVNEIKVLLDSCVERLKPDGLLI